jgi:hypothetical protein
MPTGDRWGSHPDAGENMVLTTENKRFTSERSVYSLPFGTVPGSLTKRGCAPRAMINLSREQFAQFTTKTQERAGPLIRCASLYRIFTRLSGPLLGFCLNSTSVNARQRHPHSAAIEAGG